MAKLGRKRLPEEQLGVNQFFKDINHSHEWGKVKVVCNYTKEGKGDDDVYNASQMPNLRN